MKHKTRQDIISEMETKRHKKIIRNQKQLKKNLDRFDLFSIGLTIGLIIALIASFYGLYSPEENLSKCYTNITPSGYFTDNEGNLSNPIILYNDSLMIKAYDKVHASQTAGTGSMNPLMKKGSILIYVYPKKISIGDIIIYKNGNESIVHRVIDITDDGFILKGDHNKYPDEGFVKENMIEGKVVGILW